METPLNGVDITVTPLDNDGLGDGATPFARTYGIGTNVTLTAPARPGSPELMAFEHWIVDGVAQPEDQTQIIVTSANSNAVAQFAIVGDMNGDGAFDGADIEPFFLALSNYAAYQAAFPGLNGLKRGDCNGDGALDGADIEAFFVLLSG